MLKHIVQQGEHLCTLAKKHGFYDYETIWNHPSNQKLRSDRDNPNVLFPGDIVNIPDKLPKTENRPAGQLHRFQIKAKRPALRIRVSDYFDRVIANTKCVLEIEGQAKVERTDSKGLIESPCDPLATKGRLIIRGSDIEVRIGHLDPPDHLSGQVARLNNLGYGAGSIDSPQPDLLQSAIEEFQCDQQLAITGQCDSATQARLKKVHGC